MVHQIKYARDDRVFSGQRVRCRHFNAPDKIQRLAEFYFLNFSMSFFFKLLAVAQCEIILYVVSATVL
jgi:hypothetical protein